MNIHRMHQAHEYFISRSTFSPGFQVIFVYFQQLTEKSLHPPDGFKLGITRGSNEEAYFKNHVEDLFRKIYHDNLKIHLVDGFQTGMQQLTDK